MKFRLKASGPADTAHATVSVTNSGDESFTLRELDAGGDPIDGTDVALGPEENHAWTLSPGDGRNGVLKISGPDPTGVSRRWHSGIFVRWHFFRQPADHEPVLLHRIVRCLCRRLDIRGPGQQTSLTVTAVTDNLGNTYSATNAGSDNGNITGRAFYSRVTVPGTLTS